MTDQKDTADPLEKFKVFPPDTEAAQKQVDLAERVTALEKHCAEQAQLLAEMQPQFNAREPRTDPVDAARAERLTQMEERLTQIGAFLQRWGFNFKV